MGSHLSQESNYLDSASTWKAAPELPPRESMIIAKEQPHEGEPDFDDLTVQADDLLTRLEAAHVTEFKKAEGTVDFDLIDKLSVEIDGLKSFIAMIGEEKAESKHEEHLFFDDTLSDTEDHRTYDPEARRNILLDLERKLSAYTDMARALEHRVGQSQGTVTEKEIEEAGF